MNTNGSAQMPFGVVSSGSIGTRPDKRSYQDFRLSQGQAAPSQSSGRYNPVNTTSLSIVLANNFSNSNAHHAHQSNGLQHHPSMLQHALSEQSLTQFQNLIPGSYFPTSQNIQSQSVPTSQSASTRHEPPHNTLSQEEPRGISPPDAEAALAPVKNYFQQMWDGTRDEMQNQLGKQKGQYEELLAREKALGMQRLEQAVAILSGRHNQVYQELQRVTSLYHQTQSENHALQKDAENYKVEIRGFIASRKQIEKKNELLRQENIKLSEELEAKDARIKWLSQEWSTGRALRLKLHGENQQLLQELKDVKEKTRTELRQEFEANIAKVLANAQTFRLVKQNGPGDLQPFVSGEPQTGPSNSFDALEDQEEMKPITVAT